MNWNKGFSASYYITEVDPVTWKDIDRIEITQGSVKRTDADLRASASLDCVNFDQSREKWVRVYLDARQGDSAEHTALFTGLASSPTKNINGVLVNNSVDCYSVLKPCEDVLLARGWYAPAGVSGETILKNLLEPTPAPVEIEENSPKLLEAVVAENHENHLSMIDKILVAIGWRLKLQGDGTIYIGPVATEPIYTYDPLNNDSVEPIIEVTHDWYQVPNVFRATSGDSSEVAKDESIDSRVSIVGRGREVWKEDASCQLNVGETLSDYARRRLNELQRVQLTAKYNRRHNPIINTSDLIRLHYPEQGLDGVFFIKSQSIELSYGARTTEEVVLYE